MKVERMVRLGQISRQARMRSNVFSCAAGRRWLSRRPASL